MSDEKCQRCGHQRMQHIYGEGACRPGFVCKVACQRFIGGKKLTDDELLAGLWWGDPEFHPVADDVWHEYVEALRAWNIRKASYANTLRYFLERAERTPYAETFDEKRARS